MLDDDSRTERFLTPAATRFPSSGRLQILLSFLDLRRGRPDAAIDRIRRTVEKVSTTVEALLVRSEVATIWLIPPIQNVTIHTRRGEIAAALDWLERAYQAGWRDARTTRLIPMWASLRREPRFEQLVARMEADIAAMRKRADYSGLP